MWGALAVVALLTLLVLLAPVGAVGRGGTYGYGFGEPVADRDGERVRAELRSVADRQEEEETARGR